MQRGSLPAGDNPHRDSQNAGNLGSHRCESEEQNQIQSRVYRNASSERTGGDRRETGAPGPIVQQQGRIEGKNSGHTEMPHTGPSPAQNRQTISQQYTEFGTGLNAAGLDSTVTEEAKRLSWLLGFGEDPGKKRPDLAVLLPEPALTSLLPQNRVNPFAPQENNSKLLTLAAIAAQPLYDPQDLRRRIISRLNANQTYWPASKEFFRDIIKHDPPWNSDERTKVLPGLQGPTASQPKNPTKLTQLQVVLRDIVLEILRETDKHTAVRLKREFALIGEDAPATTCSGRKLKPYRHPASRQQNTGQSGALQGGVIRNGAQDVSNIEAHGNPAPQPKKRKILGTSKNVNLRRFEDRGHSDGFVSFGEFLQVDMPSASLSHFALAKGTVAQYHSCQVMEMEPNPVVNIFWKFLARPDFTIRLATHLRVQELIILYSISRRFHDIVKLRLTTVVVAQAKARAPGSAKIFPFRCYSRLCVDDPAKRPHPVTEKAAAGEVRKVPSMRWLLMVCFREMVCHEIVTFMAEDGVTVPDQCEQVLKKVWFLMDIPDNRRRIGMVQNRELFTDLDLFFGIMFFVKLDMRFTDPITGSGRDGMRRLLMSQPSLSMLWKALKRTALIAKIDVVKLFIRWKYQPRPNQVGESLFGIPPNEIGMTQYEAWGRTESRAPLQRPDELLLMESIRRNLKLEDKYPDMFLWGYIDPNTMDNMLPVARKRRLDSLEELEEELTPVGDREVILPPKRISTRVLQE